MKEIEKKILDENGHLNEHGIMLYADAMKLVQVEKLPEFIQEHLHNCTFCSTKVIDLFKLIEDLDYSHQIHPILGLSQDVDFTLDADSSHLEAVLQQLLDDAIQLPVFENLIETQFAYRNSKAKDLFQVLKPQSEQVCIRFIDFLFSQAITKKTFISLTHHNGRILKELIPIGNKEYRIDIADDFTPGLYYWKVMIEGEKALVGKVFIWSNIS